MLAPRKATDQAHKQFQEHVTRSMASATEQGQALTNMMNQLLDGFNDLNASQIETREALREVQARTEAVEAYTAEIDKRIASAPTSPTTPADLHHEGHVRRPRHLLQLKQVRLRVRGAQRLHHRSARMESGLKTSALQISS